MINDFYPDEKDEYCNTCRTTGCSCCSTELHIERDKDKILEELKDNIRVAKKACKYYKVPFSKFQNEVILEEDCKEHQFYKKYSEQEVCSKCGYWKPKEMNNGMKE